MRDIISYTEDQAKEIAAIKGCGPEEVGTEPFSLSQIAAGLYDGGWRKEDKDELIQEYQMTYTGGSQEAEDICEWLEEFECRETEGRD